MIGPGAGGALFGTRFRSMSSSHSNFTEPPSPGGGPARLWRRFRALARLLRRRAARAPRAARRWLRSLAAAPTVDNPGPRLSLWFGVVGFVCIMVTSMATAALLSRSMTNTWIAQDERSLSDFVSSAVIAHGAEPLFEGVKPPAEMSKELDTLFRVIAGRDPVFLAHFYSPQGEIFWSSDPVFVGKTFAANDELAAALRGETATEIGELSNADKPEHSLVDPSRVLFVETYIPIFAGDDQVAGVIEIYRTPKHLQEAIDRSRQLIWTSTLLSGLALYLTLGWIARWGDRQLERSARELAESNSLAAIGELATAVAHGLRNPLAAMRSSAELALDAPSLRGHKTALHEVMRQTDRLDEWIRALLGALRTEQLQMAPADAATLLQDAEASARSRIDAAGLKCELRTPETPVMVHVHRPAALQILECLIANALEATPRGGNLNLTCRRSEDGAQAWIEVRDDGPGPDARSDPFALFLTTKGAGIGVGLPIARRLARLELPLLNDDDDDEAG